MATTICKKPRLCTMQETDGYIHVIRPYILVHLGTQKVKQYALMDTGADVNSLSYKSWESMGNPKLEPSTITLASYTGDASTVEGYLDIQMYIHNTDVSHRFYVLRQGHGNTPVLLGLPWQRKYNGLPSWKKEGITYKVNDKEFFQPFMGAEFIHRRKPKNPNQPYTLLTNLRLNYRFKKQSILKKTIPLLQQKCCFRPTQSSPIK